MKIIGLMLARNEDWCIGLSARVALRWCDELVIVDHDSTDSTPKIVNDLQREFKRRVHPYYWPYSDKWEEMVIRQFSLEKGRELGGTHFAIVDCDEFLTANLIFSVQDWVRSLKPGQILDVPMIPAWRSLNEYRDDNSVWSHAWLTLAFADKPNLSWQPAGDGYQHHNRPPYGCVEPRVRPLEDKRMGGVVHAQFANWRRLLAKHALYKLKEVICWPGRETIQEIEWKYNQSSDETDIKLTKCPPAWLYPELMAHYNQDGVPWQEEEVKRLIQKYGAEKFNGLSLFGLGG